MNRVILAVTAVCVYLYLVILVTILPTGVSMPTTVSVVPSKTIVSPNQTFTVSINLDSTESLAGAQFNLYFNPAVVRVDSEVEGAYFKRGYTTFYVAGVSGSGSVKNTAIAIMGTGSVTGSGTIAVFNCTAIGEGNSNFSLDAVIGTPAATAVPLNPIIINNVEVKKMALTFNGSVSNQYAAGEVVSIKITRPDSVVETITTPTLADKTFTTTYNNNVVAGNYTILASIAADAMYKAATVTTTATVSLLDRTITLNVV